MYFRIFMMLFILGLVHPSFAEACSPQACETMPSEDTNIASKTLVPSQKPYELLIFVSLGMPEQSLRLWAEQAAQFKVPLRIRGFYKDSLLKTTQKAFEIFGENNLAGLLIDPESFEQYNIQAVPAVVLALEAREIPEKIPPLFEGVYGDTSIDAALSLIARTGCAEARVLATQLLNQYRVKVHHD